MLKTNQLKRYSNLMIDLPGSLVNLVANEDALVKTKDRDVREDEAMSRMTIVMKQSKVQNKML